MSNFLERIALALGFPVAGAGGNAPNEENPEDLKHRTVQMLAEEEEERRYEHAQNLQSEGGQEVPKEYKYGTID